MFTAAGKSAAVSAANYIEDVFSTWLYTGNGSTQTITNGIDLSTKGGLVWIKSRNDTYDHFLYDTARGATKSLQSDTTSAEQTYSDSLTAFNSNGFALGANVRMNANTTTYASWTFRKQAKFFDVVTYTGDGNTSKTVNHNLGSVPGCIIVKNTSSALNWFVYHRSVGATKHLNLNTISSATTSSASWNDTAPTSTQFTVGANSNTASNNYVAYLFAHNAGGFGLSGTDNVISCGSYTGNGSVTGPSITLGYEPQWVMIKNSSGVGNWYMLDTMRGMAYTVGNELYADLTAAEITQSKTIIPTATGFDVATTDGYVNNSGSTYIYIAIRRGPMKTPTSGTSVFGLSARSGTGANATVTGSAGVSDAVLIKNRGSAVVDLFAARLTGTGYLTTSSTAAEVAAGTTILQANPWDVMDGVKVGTTSTITNATSNTYINYLFDRAPGFFDVVCYTGTGANATQSHNLTVVPELMIIKKRNSATNGGWLVGFYVSASTGIDGVGLNDTAALSTRAWSSGNFNSAPTASVFGVGSFGVINALADTYVAYLFATCAGVSKVGSYTGTGALQTINCGFASGARFVLIKRTDSTGDWWVYDSARGITSGNDPYLFLNSAAAEDTTTNYVDTDSTGFKVTAAAPAGLNANGGTYIFLAIA